MSVHNSAKLNMTARPIHADFGKRSFLLITSNLLKLFVQLAILYIYSRLLNVEQYGLYQSIWLYVNVLSVIGLFGLPAVLLSSSEDNIKASFQKFKKPFLGILLLLNIIPIVYFFIIPNAFPIDTIGLIVAVVFVQNISILAETFAIKKQKEKKVLIANIIFNVIYLAAHLIIYKTGFLLNLLLLWLIITFSVKFLLLYNNQIFKPSLLINSNSENKLLTKQWIYLGLFDVLSVLFKWIDKWVILLLLSLTQFAIYFNGAYEIPIYGLMLSAVGNIMLVELSKEKLNTANKTTFLFHQSALFLSSIVFPSFCFLLFYSTDIFTLIFSAKYESSIPIFFVSIWVLPVRITNFTAALQVYQKTHIIVQGAVYDLIAAILLMLILYPIAGLTGVAMAFVISTYLQAGFYLWHTARLLNTTIFVLLPFKRLGLTMLLSLFSFAACKYITVSLAYPYNMLVGMLATIFIMAGLIVYYFRYDYNPKITA